MVEYEQLKYYQLVQKDIFWYYKALYEHMPDSFKISYNKKGQEKYHIEQNLYNEIIEGENQ